MSYKNNSKVYHEADIRNDYRKLTKLLIEKNLTITTMLLKMKDGTRQQTGTRNLYRIIKSRK